MLQYLSQNQPPSNKTVWDALGAVLEKPNGLYYVAGVFLIVLAWRLNTIGQIVGGLVENRKAEISEGETKSVGHIQPPFANGRLMAALEIVAREQRSNELHMLALEAARDRLEQQERYIHELERRLAMAERQLLAYTQPNQPEGGTQ